jgi:hypothetical protein
VQSLLFTDKFLAHYLFTLFHFYNVAEVRIIHETVYSNLATNMIWKLKSSSILHLFWESLLQQNKKIWWLLFTFFPNLVITKFKKKTFSHFDKKVSQLAKSNQKTKTRKSWAWASSEVTLHKLPSFIRVIR